MPDICIDDGTVFRLGESEYRFCTAERQLDWLLDSAIGFDVEISEVTEQIAALAVQGPTSCAVLKSLGLDGVERLKPFEIGHFACGAQPLTVSRTGFTGDLGYELWMRPRTRRSGLGCVDGGRTHRAAIRAIGSQALNMARIEAGFLLPNVDFVSAEHTIRTRPRPLAARAWARVAGRFREGSLHRPARAAGRAARGPRRRLVGLDIAGNKPAHNALLYAERRRASGKSAA